MIPCTYPNFLNPFSDMSECKVYYLSSVSGMTAWTDYIPVRTVVASTSVEGRTEANGYQAVHPVGSSGLVAWTDYVPVYEDATKTVPWSTDANGYIPVGLSSDGVLAFLDEAEFISELTHTAVPSEAAVGTTGTFTRATTSTWPNNDGNLVTGVAGELGFVGARRVYNALQNASIPSQDFSVAAWAASGVKSVTANYATAPDGTTTADRVVIAAGDYLRANTNLGSSSNSKTWLGSVYVKATSGTQTFRILLTQNGVANNYSSDLVATSEWQRFSFSIPFTSGGSGFLCGIADKAAGGGTDLVVWGYQAEDVTAQTTQTAGEYVSVGVESAPYYHGSMVDGVKCFATDINGSPIPSSTLLGYQAEGARTNLCLQSNAFSNVAWTNDNLPSPTQNVTGPDGATSGWTLTNDTTNAEHRLYQSIGVSAQRTVSIYAKAGTASFIALSTIGGPSGYAVFDLTNGAITGTVGGTATITAAYPAGWYRCTFTETGSVGQYFVINVGESAANAIPGTAYAGTGKTVLVAFSQGETAAFASSYIPTTTVAVTRNADVLTYSSGDIANLKTLSATFRRESGVSAAGEVLALSDNTLNNTVVIQMDNATLVRSYGVAGGVTQWNQTASNSYTAGSDSKVAVTFATNDVKSSFAGTSMTADTSATVPVVTRLEVGMVTSLFQLYGTTKGIYGWTRNLSQSELNAITA